MISPFDLEAKQFNIIDPNLPFGGELTTCICHDVLL